MSASNPAVSDTRQLCTFHVGGLFLGIDVLVVQEVLRAREIAPVPLCPAVVEGLVNLRGQIVTALDLRRVLAFPPRAPDVQPMLMIVRTDDAHVALLVDGVGDVIDVDAHTFESPPDTLPPSARELIVGVHKLPKQLLCLLDIEAAISSPASA